MIPATVLTFNVSDADFNKMRALAAPLGLRFKAVPPESFTMPLGGMLGMPAGNAAASDGEPFSDPMLLMCNLNERQFHQLLQLLRAPGLPRVPLKAVLTPHNVGWNALRLHGELVREHEAMQGR